MRPPAEVAMPDRSVPDARVSPTVGTNEGRALRASAPGRASNAGSRSETQRPALDVVSGPRRRQATSTEALTVRIVTAQGRDALRRAARRPSAPERSPFVLASHETSDVTVLAWIPLDARRRDWGARAVSVRARLLTDHNH